LIILLLLEEAGLAVNTTRVVVVQVDLNRALLSLLLLDLLTQLL
jgi:hypothetical protein